MYKLEPAKQLTSLQPETPVNFQLQVFLAVVLGICSFAGGAASVYYSVKNDIVSLREKVQNNGTRIEVVEKTKPEIESQLAIIQREMIEVKTDVKWIVRQLEHQKGSFRARAAREDRQIPPQIPSRKAGDPPS